MAHNHQIDLNVDLTDEKDEFKYWFKDQINKAIDLNNGASKKRIFLSLNTNEPLALETNIRVQNLLRSDKAFDLSINEPSSPENIIEFLRESMHDLYKKNYDEEALQKIQERVVAKDFIDTNITAEDIYIGLLGTISNFTKWLTLFAQKFPGFHKFDYDYDMILTMILTMIKAKEYLSDLKTYYINSMIAEFKANNRCEEFSKKLNDVFKIMVVLEMNKHNFQCKKV